MSVCRDVGTWITENVRQPVERFIEQAEQACTEARRWVEREVRTPVERTRETVEQRCRERDCNWWCLCCNRWFCWLVTIILIVVEFIIEVVGEWLVELVCRIIVRVIKIIVEVVITVLRFVVLLVVCLFTEPHVVLADLWFDLLDIVSDVRDLIIDVLDAVSDLLVIVEEFLLNIADNLGPLGRFFIGIIGGILDIVRRIVDGVRRIVDGIFEIVLGILSLDFCRALGGLINGVGFGVGQVIFGATGVLSLAANGPRDAIERDVLRAWLQNQLNERFRGEELANLNKVLGMNTATFGTFWTVNPFVCSISSRSPDLDLRQMHRDGTLSLFEAAGYAPIGCKDSPADRRQWRLVYRDTDYRVSLSDIKAYLDGTDTDAPEFELVSGNREVLRKMLIVAERKFRQIGIHIQYEGILKFEINSMSEFAISASATPLITRLKQQFGLSTLCDLPAGFVFGYSPQQFGLASVFWRGTSTPVATGATVRSTFMNHLFGTVLAHEMGHAFSICHAGHDGMEHIMYTRGEESRNCGIVGDPSIVTGGQLETITAGTVIEYLLLGGEPRFTSEDGKQAWLWILIHARSCVH